jgi:hypothetical protein
MLKKLSYFPLRPGTRQRRPLLQLIPHSGRSSSQCSKAKNEIKGTQIGKEELNYLYLWKT